MDKLYYLNEVNPELITVLNEDDIYNIIFTSEPEVSCIINKKENTAIFNDDEAVTDIAFTNIINYLI